MTTPKLVFVLLLCCLSVAGQQIESDDFKAEKVIPAGREISLTIGPLKPGTYEFHDEYHEKESKSRLIVK